ncbi:MAG: ral nucleoside transport system permease protein [Acidobacteriota bacterium]|jgi:simple sugar transport system permease protein|nr:ral nucleoside transport system permease protein [Acidobacteriota bacterium]
MKLLRELMFPVIAVLVAFVVGGIIVWVIGDNPFEVYGLLLGSALTWPDGIGYTLFYATPLIFTGLAVAVAFRCGLLNIGAEGQLYAAAFATAWVSIKLGGTVITGFDGKPINYAWASLPAVVLVPLAVLTAVAVGAAWGAIPGWLKARFGAHEVITTIMLNFIAVALISYFTQYYYKAPGDPIMESVPIGGAAHIPRLGSFVPGMPGRLPVNVAFLLAILACALVYVFLWRTKWGYEIRATGASPSAAEYGGINVRKQIILAMAVSGALAGMVGVNEVLGYRHRYYDGFSDNYGFTGIAVALLGRNHPVGVILAALLFGMLQRGGIFVDAFSVHVSKDLVQVLQGVVILFVAAEALFRGPFSRFGLLKRSKI